MLQNTNDTNTKTDTTSSPAKSHSEYVTTIREGAIGAGIFLADRKDGTQGHYFTLSRAYKGADQQDFKYSDRFYSRNGAAIAQVALAATKKCQDLDQALKAKG